MIIRCGVCWVLLALTRSAAATPAASAAMPAATFPLERIVLVETLEAVKAPPPPDTGFVVATGALKAFDTAELSKRLIDAKGVIINADLLRAIGQVVATYIRQNDFPVAEIVVPEQNIREGVLRLVVLLGKLRQIRTQGNHWFSQSMLQERLGVAQGNTIRWSELERSVAWANNTNPFRQLKLHLDPVSSNPAEYDLVVGVEDRLPLRLALGYDNTGNEILGIDRYSAGLTYGNLWGLDHQATYQFTTGDDPKIFNGHSLSYQAPLRWRHVVQASVAYVQVAPTFLEGYFKQKGKSIVADAKYIIPFKGNTWQGEVSGSVGFREMDNNLEFSGTPVLGATTDVFLGTLGAAAIREDKRGKWITSLTLTASPGTLNSRSKEKVYAENRVGAKPLFAHLQATVQRQTMLTPSLSSTLRATAQVSSANLLPSEQFSLGGMGTVRGYKERIISGDHGYILGHELQQRLPDISLGARRPKLELAGVAFWEYGRAILDHPLPSEFKSQHLASAGLGLRAQFSTFFSSSIDFARQLEEVEIPGEPHHRVHVRVTLSY